MLYLIGTALGNMEDIGLRAITCIFSSQIILAEDTRKFGILYMNLKKRWSHIINMQLIKPRIMSFHKLNEFEISPKIIQLLKKGTNISLVSEAGMPCINDPGNLLLNECIRENISFKIIPGPTAFVTALVYSGFNTHYPCFLGYFPKQKSQQKKLLNYLKFLISSQEGPDTVIFYDSPKRINKTLKLLSHELSNAHFCVCREMTKKFEEIVRFKSNNIPQRTWKGEITVVLKVK